MIMHIFWTIAMVITGIFVFYAALPLCTILLAALSSKGEKTKASAPIPTDFACIITAYGDPTIAIEQVHSLLIQFYRNFHIYVVADNWSVQPAFPIHEKVTVLYPEKPLHAKLKSIQFAIDAFIRPHTAILVLDADNLVHQSGLGQLHKMLEQGYIAVQGQRTAKNLDTPVAALDALGELYYNISQRWAPFKIGSSATIAGSGMAVEATFFTNYVSTLLAGGDKLILAEDKLLQMMLVEGGHQIAYCREALIFDEKVRDGAQVQRQRTRWLRSWFDHWGQAIALAAKGLLKGSWNQLYFGIMLSFPPMVLLVAALLGFIFVGILFYVPMVFFAATGLGLFLLGFFVALVIAPAPELVWSAIPYIPLFVIRQILAILKIKASNKDFMATTHTQYISMHKVWEQRKQDFPYMKNIV